MNFDYSDFHLPLSDYQKTLTASSALSPDYAKPLNEQAEVLLNILKEMDELSAILDMEVKEKKYEQDHLKKIYDILERQEELFRIWDDKKEILYEDVRAVFNSYPPPDASNTWQVSGKALRELTDLDRGALFKAKRFYLGDSTIKISTDIIDLALRDVISNEYDNMQGIQKIGRNNGLCPYTPYEDLPQTSKQLSELVKKLKPAGSLSGYNHPYHSIVYLYNEIVDDYNKFCTLSAAINHLKTVKQPELFLVKYPETKAPVKLRSPDQTSIEQQKVDKRGDTDAAQKETAIVSGSATVIRDTVYIEKRDTIYLSGNTENLRSMEGYATNNMILLLDVSGSMNHPDKLPLLKESMLGMLSMMRTEDRISIIAFSGKLKILLKSTSFNEDIFLSVFNFGTGAGSSRSLQRLAISGKGNYESISKENIQLKLIREAKAKKKK